MASTYFLDESGSTGDLVKTGPAFDFAQQPVFALACFGNDDEADLKDELQRLRTKYRVHSAELKSKVLAAKSGFVTELAAYLRQKSLPIFIEVVKKRFFICATMVNHLVMPAVGPVDLEPDTLFIKNTFAEYLDANVSNSVLQAYVDACDECSTEATRKSFETLLAWLKIVGPTNEIAEGLRRFAEDSQKEFEDLVSRDPEGWRAGLPIPDLSRRGKRFWILPNLSSLTNIYARINHFQQQRIGGLELVHDEQAQYDKILAEAKTTAEGLSTCGMALQTLHANYNFTEQARLTFKPSAECVGIQVADVLAGFVMRFVQGVVVGNTSADEDSLQAFRAISGLCAPARGVGINFVLPHRDIERL